MALPRRADGLSGCKGTHFYSYWQIFAFDLYVHANYWCLYFVNSEKSTTFVAKIIKNEGMDTGKTMETPKILKRYRRYLRLERSYSDNTIDAYMHDIEKLLVFLSSEHLEVTEVGLADLQHFAAALVDAGIAARSQARIISGIRSLYRFLVMDGHIEQDPTELLESPQLGDHIPEVLSVEEVDMLESAIDLSQPEGQRNKAIIEVLFSCGLRVSELVNLTLQQLFLEQGFIRVYGKGKKERLVPISRRAIEELNYWFIDRNSMKIKEGEGDYVFLNRRGAHLTRTMILIMVKRLAVEAGIKKTISPHTLRHSFATALLEGGADLRSIQAMLGHEKIGTTEIYTHLDMTHLRDDILHCHPRNIARGCK